MLRTKGLISVLLCSSIAVFSAGRADAITIPAVQPANDDEHDGDKDLGRNDTVEIEITQELNGDWEYKFVLTKGTIGAPQLFSFHVRGLKGDVEDDDEYDDFFPTTAHPTWGAPVRDKANSKVGWTFLAGGIGDLQSAGDDQDFYFDSIYSPKEMSAASMFSVGVDYKGDNNIYWSSPISLTGTVPDLPDVPLPASLPLFLSAGAFLGLLGFRRSISNNTDGLPLRPH